MNVQIITSSYPVTPDDPAGTAGLFVREFALELLRQGHSVVINPVTRAKPYDGDNGLTIEPLPWLGGDQELASMNFFNPFNWFIFLHFFIKGTTQAIRSHADHNIDKVLCMWVVPSGIFGFRIGKKLNKKYDVWALGSDIWKIRKIPVIGNWILRTVIGRADGVWADGLKLADDVKAISGKECKFLPSSRRLPSPRADRMTLEPKERIHFLFVGRYHPNKGPDLLIEAVHQLPADYKKQITVHMFGAGPMKEYLQKIIRDYQLPVVVQFNGLIGAQELSDYLHRVSYLIIPSRIESIPVIFSDALQLDRPVVAMPVGDLKRLIETMHCGIVAEQPDAQALAQAMMRAIETDPKEFQVKNLENKKYFNISHNVTQWIQQP